MAIRHAAMLEVNEFLVLDFIRGEEQTTRPEISRALGLSPSSVSRMVGRLLRGGLVVERRGTSAGAGRPSSVIAFNHAAASVLAVDLGGTRCHGALANLSGTILIEDVRPTQGRDGAYGALTATIETLTAAALERSLPVRALAVGIPAILDPATGTALGGPHVEWEGFDVVGRLQDALDFPVLVENDANLAALAHAWRGDGREVSDFVAISIGTGIGAAVVANGQLVKGRHNAAGEIGYLLMGRDQLRLRPEGSVGGFEAMASGPAIARRAAELRAAATAASLLEAGSARTAGTGAAVAPRIDGAALTPEQVFASATSDPVCGQVIDEVLDWVAIALVAVTATVDPELIVLEGRVGIALGPYLDEIARRMSDRLPVAPRLSVSRLGPDATMLGAIAAALQLTHRRGAPAALFRAFDVGQKVTS